jgi:hypothetical protein
MWVHIRQSDILHEAKLNFIDLISATQQWMLGGRDNLTL